MFTPIKQSHSKLSRLLSASQTRAPQMPAWLPFAGAALFCVAAPAMAQEGAELDQALSLGAYWARGDYGDSVETEILYLPATYEANLGKWGLQVMVPHLEVTGLGNVLVNVGGVTQAVAGTEITTKRGMGDTMLSLLYRFDPMSATAPFVDFRLDIKLPTADENKSLGTGEVDYSAQFDFTRAFGDAVGFATLGYNVRGRSPLFDGLQDSAFAQLGLQFPLRPHIGIGAYYDFREPASTFSKEVHEILPYISWQISERWSLTGLTSFGFTEASAEHTVLGQLRFSW